MLTAKMVIASRSSVSVTFEIAPICLRRLIFRLYMMDTCSYVIQITLLLKLKKHNTPTLVLINCGFIELAGTTWINVGSAIVC